ncbi:TetR family transcriptional regulator [Sciscionella sediminilitoris]|uniref:TetR family transcriptional regulator n=1 Tax=Sciscionella sediminilitoris TaxID=1445613 RepID=UPI0004DEE23B|nr:TetR family transcriptional regulator [Sciscionella sp. SE31]
MSAEIEEGTLSLRERKKHRTRSALAETALDLFDADGFDGVTLDELVAAVEVSKRTFFRYFDSKEDVAFTSGKQLWSAVLAEAETFVPEGTVLDGLVDLLVGVLGGMGADWADRHRRLQRLLESTPVLRGYAREYCDAVSRELVSMLTARLGSKVERLTLRMVVELMLAAWHCGVRDWSESGGRGAAGLARRVRAAADTLPACLALTG